MASAINPDSMIWWTGPVAVATSTPSARASADHVTQTILSVVKEPLTVRYLIPVTLLLLTALSALAADEPKTSPLSRKEISDGWLMLFDGEDLFGWNAVNNAKWSVFNGMLYPQAD